MQECQDPRHPDREDHHPYDDLDEGKSRCPVEYADHGKVLVVGSEKDLSRATGFEGGTRIAIAEDDPCMSKFSSSRGEHTLPERGRDMVDECSWTADRATESLYHNLTLEGDDLIGPIGTRPSRRD